MAATSQYSIALEPEPAAADVRLNAALQRLERKLENLGASHAILRDVLLDVRAGLPRQRRALSERTKAMHVFVTWSRRNGLCACCQERQVCTAEESLPDAQFDHWYSRHRAGPRQTWLVCSECNRALEDTEFKAAARSAFEAYQQALRPFLSARQESLPLRP